MFGPVSRAQFWNSKYDSVREPAGDGFSGGYGDGRGAGLYDSLGFIDFAEGVLMHLYNDSLEAAVINATCRMKP